MAIQMVDRRQNARSNIVCILLLFIFNHSNFATTIHCGGTLPYWHILRAASNGLNHNSYKISSSSYMHSSRITVMNTLKNLFNCCCSVVQ